MADSDSKPYGIVYCATNKVNGKRYVGQTTSTLKRRWSMHCCPGGNCKSFSGAIQKYGKHSFDIVEIASAETLDELNEKEEYFISLFKTSDRLYGYNLRPGGNSSKPSAESKALMSKAKVGRTLSEETKAKISAALKGQPKTAEHSLNVSIAKKGRPFSDAHKKRMSESRLGVKHSDARREAFRLFRLGTKLSEETKRRISEATRGKPKRKKINADLI